MKSLQEYIEIYRNIAQDLNLRGDSVEMLSQLLANATYISEVEHISYSQEASLERSSQMNSKIQHCMDEMYSVFRGSCPRVLIHITSTSYLDLNVYDEIASFNNFNLYYVGYCDSSKEDLNSQFPKITYSSYSVPPNKEITIMALISPKALLGEWTITSNNQYYVNFPEINLSNDLQVRINGSIHNTTRHFPDHVKEGSIFDLTIPDFGLRLYFPNIFKSELESINVIPTNTKISLKVFRYSELSSYNSSELKQIKIKGGKLTPFPELTWNYYGIEEAPGLIFIKEVERDTINTIHYKVNRNRYVGSMIRSNSDIGHLLEEMYPEKIVKSGTSYVFDSNETIPEVVSKFGFIPNDSINGETFRVLKGLSSVSSDSLETVLIDSDNKTLPLTVFSSNEYPITTYFNNPAISYQPENLPNLMFTNSKLSLDSTGLFKDGAPFGGIVKIPISGSGTLKIFHKISYDFSTDAVYEILPSNSVILLGKNGLLTKDLVVNIIKTSNGSSEILDLNNISENYYISCKYIYYNSNGNKNTIENNYITNKISLNENTIIYRDISEVILQLFKENDLGEDILLDEEVIPIVKTDISSMNSTGVTSTLPPTSITSAIDIVLSLSNDKISLESDYLGNIVTLFPIEVTASVFSGGNQVTSGINYSLEKPSGIQANITKDGLLTISSVENIRKNNVILVKATYNGVTIISQVQLQTVLTEDSLRTRILNVSDDPSGQTILKQFESKLFGQLSELKYSNRTGKTSLYIWLSGVPSIDLYSIEWISDEVITSNPNSLVVFPRLTIYYIPQSASSLLTDEEISKYIDSRSSYFVTQEVSVLRGTRIEVLAVLDVEVFKNESIDSEINKIFEEYTNRFNVDLESKKNEISSSIGKIPNIRSLNGLSFFYKTELGDEISLLDYQDLNLMHSYFVIEYQINSQISN